MPKTLKRPGKNTSVEVQGISGLGIWLWVDAKEYFLPFSLYPWFRSGTVEQVFNVTRPKAAHLHWPDLDVDLELAGLERPDDFPLVFQGLSVGDGTAKAPIKKAKRTR
jgi:hypothetical protein